VKQPYDPKLREAAEEFEKICEKYDCAGVVLFVSPTHSEFATHISPSWSVARMESPAALRFRSRRADFESKEEQVRCTEASMHMFTSIIEWSRKLNEETRSIVRQISQHMGVVWQTWGDPDSVPGDGK
jgi:hypothetical protein